MHLRILHASHIGEVDVSAVLPCRLYAGSASIDVAFDGASLDENLGLAIHLTEVVGAAVFIVTVWKGAQTGSVDVMRCELAVGLDVCVAADIAGKATAVYLKQCQSACACHPCQTACVIASERVRVVVAAVIAAVIEHLFFLRHFLVVIKHGKLQIQICLKVLVLTEIAILDAVNGQNAAVVNLCSRLCIHLRLAYLCVGAISCAEH